VEQRSNYGTRSIIAPLLPNTQVLAWLGRRKTDAEIALIFGRSARTVKKQVKPSWPRLAQVGVENRTNAAVAASRKVFEVKGGSHSVYVEVRIALGSQQRQACRAGE
jgi:DNA-binding CsgD family transcriptional regulator